MKRYIIQLENGEYTNDLDGYTTDDIKDAYLFKTEEEAIEEIKKFDPWYSAIVILVTIEEKQEITRTIKQNKIVYFKNSAE